MTMANLFEAVVLPASGGFGMYERHAEGPQETEFGSMEEFTAHMDREYVWQWAPEIDGKIYNQGGGRALKWRMPEQTDSDGWSYGLIWY